MATTIISEPAKMQLENFKKTQETKLIKYITEEKLYPGADEIEISAQDIKLYSNRIYFKRRKTTYFTKLLFIVMLLFGIILMLVALFYDMLLDMYKESPIRFVIIVYGVFCVFFSIVMMCQIHQKNKLDKSENEFKSNL